MPFRCVEFSGYIGWIGSFLILSAFLWIMSFATTPFGAAGKLMISVLRIGLGILSAYMFLNMLGTITGLRGNCPQGYRSGWPPLHPAAYHRDPATGLRVDDPQKPLWE